MPLKTQHCLIRRHSATIVDHLYQRPARILNDYGHLIGTGIHGILHKFLHHGCRSLNDLSRSDHVCYITW